MSRSKRITPSRTRDRARSSAGAGHRRQEGHSRSGDAFIPMDETLAHAVVECLRPPYCRAHGEPDHLRHTTIAAAPCSITPCVKNGSIRDPGTNARIALMSGFLYGSRPAPHHRGPVKASPGRCVKRSTDRSASVGRASTKGPCEGQIRCGFGLRVRQLVRRNGASESVNRSM